MTEIVPIKRALISVSDKSGLAELASALDSRGVELVSTGGTAQALAAAGHTVRDVYDLTGFPEMMDGRLKTLHPKVHGGLLYRRGDAAHEADAQHHDIGAIDLLVVNLYPFEDTAAGGADFATCVENIDIGGPAMIRAGAKNHDAVCVIVDPDDYDALLADLDKHGGSSLALRKTFAAKAFARTAAYDAAISGWFAETLQDATPAYRTFGGRRIHTLRYGENPHQTAAFYATPEVRPGVATATQHQGKALSYNNLNDTDAAFELVAEFDANTSAAVAIIKHANPCGVAAAGSLIDAYKLALRCDPVSAFGGVVAVNRAIDGPTAELMTEIFTEVVIAPDADANARDVFAAKPNLRLLTTGDLPDPRAQGTAARTLAGGLLVQSRDNSMVEDLDLRVVTKRAPTDSELRDMTFAFKVAKHVKSNAIVYAKDNATVGIGAGQMSRIDSTRIAARKGQDATQSAGLAANASLIHGSVVASDAFFPFPDGLIAAAEAGATAVIQPGGSIKDEAVIAAADERGLAMVLTGVRHFRH